MRRITLTVVTTLAVLILLFSYRTSRDQPVTASTVAVGSAHVVTAGAATAVSSSAAGPDPNTAAPTGEITAAPTPSSSSSNRRLPVTTAPSAPSRVRTPATTTPSIASKNSVKSTTAAPTPTPPTTTKVDGAVVSTQYGDVQVEVTITGGKITDVQALQFPNQEPRDQQINADALPRLQAQVISAQSANIDGVSGATFTTQGYIGSLQSALDAAKFK